MTTTLVGTPDDDIYARYRAMHAERIAAVGRVIRVPLKTSLMFRAPLAQAATVIKGKKA